MTFRVSVALLAFLVVGSLPIVAGGLLPEVRSRDTQTLFACLNSRTADLAASCIGDVARQCIKPGDGIEQRAECIVRERAVWELLLNNDYEGALAAIRPAAQSGLREIQVRFLNDMERRCTFVREASGTSSPDQIVEIEQCKLRATATQWLWLREFPMKRQKPPRW